MANIFELPPVLVYEKTEEFSEKLSQRQESLCIYKFSRETDLFDYICKQNQALLLIGAPFSSSNLVPLLQKIPSSTQIDILIPRDLSEEEENYSAEQNNFWLDGVSLNKEALFWKKFHKLRAFSQKHQENLSLHQQLNDKNRKWEASTEYLKHHNSELMQFTHTVAHDLKHPLGTIISYLDLLHDTLPEGDGSLTDPKKVIERVKRSSNRLVAMIRGMLRFANNTENDSSEVTEVDLNEVVSSVLEDLELGVHSSKAQIDCKELPIIMGAQTQIYQVFLNLISNAIKYHKVGEAPKVEIYSDIVNGRDEGKDKVKICRIYVKDCGVGIQPEHMNDIFMPFSKIETIGEPVEGSGVGLATVKRIVSRHAGSIHVESEANKGSTFILSFPIHLVKKAMPFLRKELRYECLDERLLQSVRLSPSQEPFNLKVINESDNGLCCECPEGHQLEIGNIIEVGNNKKYQVRWIKPLPSGEEQLGLKVVK